MSSHFSWVLRVLLYLPLLLIVGGGWYGYSNYQFGRSLETCMSAMPSSRKQLIQHEEMKRFVGCLQTHNNPLTLWRTQPQKLYQLTQPHTPCQWLGKWLAIRGNATFIIELTPDAKYLVSDVKLPNQDEASFTGVWSSPKPDTIIWFYEGAYNWPLDENFVEWKDADHLTIHELNGSVTRYQRQSPHIDKCPYHP